MPPINRIFGFAEKCTEPKIKLPNVVKKCRDSEGNNLILTKEINNSENSNYKEGHSKEVLTLYKENEHGEGLSRYQELERKEVQRNPKGISFINKQIFDNTGKLKADYTDFRDGHISAASPELDITIEKFRGRAYAISYIKRKSRYGGTEIKSLRPEIKRIFKIIAKTFKQ